MSKQNRMNFNPRKRSSGIDGWTIILCIIVAVILIQTGIVKP